MLLAALGVLFLVGCSADQAAKVQAAVLVACRVDAVAQPIVVALAPLAGQQVALAGALDAQLVHPAVVAACAALGGNVIGVSVPVQQ
jgi:hypothetical protein